MKVTRFEDLDVWKRARELYAFVFKISATEPFCNDFRFRDQIRSSSGSVADNIAEGFDRGGNKEFIQFLSVAKGSCAETRSQSYRASDIDYISQSELEQLLEKTDQLSGKITNLIKAIKRSDHLGVKYDQR
jgi:four helix bundle protein